jgi:ABC-2 type transport system permease protein
VSNIGTDEGRIDRTAEFDAANFGFLERPDLPARVVSAKVRLRTRFGELWKSRELFVFFVRRDLKIKYKGSVLGLLWSMLNPAVVLLVYYVVFKYFLANPTPYFAVYLFSGLLVWNFFSTALIGSSSAIVGSAAIVKKVAFPREILALSQVGTATMFFFFQAGVMMLFLVGFQFAPAWRYLPLIPFALVDLVIFTAAISVFLSAANVYLRDVEHLIAVLVQTWFWGVPIIYSFNQIDRGHHRWLGVVYLIDPIVPIILTFQRALYGIVSYVNPSTHTRVVQLANYPYHFYVEMLAWVFGVAVALFLLSLVIFGRLEGNFAEEL